LLNLPSYRSVTYDVVSFIKTGVQLLS